MEIERKFLLSEVPKNLESYPCYQIEQGYLCTDPVVRIRKEDEVYYLTYKSNGMMAREEYNLHLNREAYLHLREKIDGNMITKKRYHVPIEGKLTAEVDVFEGSFEGLIIAEVEFSSVEEAKAFEPVSWFGQEVTWSGDYHNSALSTADPAKYLTGKPVKPMKKDPGCSKLE